MTRTSRLRLGTIVCLSAVAAATARAPAAENQTAPQPAAQDLSQLPIEDLMNIEVTSVAKESQNLAESPAAVTVITQEDIRRSGLTSIAEILRMVPGLQVARMTSDEWAITSRGFNGLYVGKMLVLLDGRTVYTPLFAGVHWDVQDTLLEDIERIEVIRGPGASVWGANAVNGVINIITKSAADTTGGLTSATTGTEDRGIGGLRYGGSLGNAAFYRTYVKYFTRDALSTASGAEANDDWRSFRSGFRIDWRGSRGDSLTVEGDGYRGRSGATETTASLEPPYSAVIDDRIKVAGGDVLGRWKRSFSPSSDLMLQVYFDRYDREEALLGERVDTSDLEFQHHRKIGALWELVWGVGYRHVNDRIDNTFTVSFDPANKATDLYSAFAEGLFRSSGGRLHLTLGTKWEHNDYSQGEVQPTLRALWRIDERQSVWAAVSRAVKTPTRNDHGLRVNFAVFPTGPGQLGVVSLIGDRSVVPEEVLAYETGFRAQTNSRASLDATVFYDDYEDLRTQSTGQPFFEAEPPPAHVVFPQFFSNDARAAAYGAEIEARYRVMARWQLTVWYASFRLEIEPQRNASIDEGTEEDSPRHQAYLKSSLELPRDIDLEAALHYVDTLPNQNVPSYLRADLRLLWRPIQGLEASFGAQNLLDRRHKEFGDLETPFQASEVERSYDVRLAWRF